MHRSSKKQETYLYLLNKDDFDAVPEALKTSFGKPEFVVTMNLTQDKKLAQADTDKVLSELKEKGFYLQLPPPVENLLKAHLEKKR